MLLWQWQKDMLFEKVQLISNNVDLLLLHSIDICWPLMLFLGNTS
jgi:hypothetical protein